MKLTVLPALPLRILATPVLATSVAAGEAGPVSCDTTITVDYEFPASVAAADLDGDGDADVLTTAIVDDSVLWFENAAGDGSSWIDHVVTTALYLPKSVEGFDADGDGDVDLLVASYAEIAWFENAAGDGSLWSRHTVAAGLVMLQDAVPADLDGDGDPDVFAGGAQDGAQASWFENADGLGGVWIEHAVADDVDHMDVDAADLDGDGDLDPLAAFFVDGTAGWYENQSTGSSFGAHDVAVGGIGMHVDSADLDADGDVDVLTAAVAAPGLAWHENERGDGSTWAAHTISPWLVTSLELVDFDEDADLDVLTASTYSSSVVWHENVDGSGLSWEDRSIAFVPGVSNDAAVADFDGDGDGDVVVSSQADDRVAWYERSTSAVLPNPGVPPNPDAFLPDPVQSPVIGSEWAPLVDHTSFAPGAVVDFVLASPAATNLVLPFGTLVCDLAHPAALVELAPAGEPFELAIPGSCAALDVTVYLQGGSIRAGGTPVLANGLTVVLGTL